MDSSQISRLFEFREVSLESASHQSSKERDQSLGESISDISVCFRKEVSGTYRGGSIEVDTQRLRWHHEISLNSIDDSVQKGLVGDVQSLGVLVTYGVGLVGARGNGLNLMRG